MFTWVYIYTYIHVDCCMTCCLLIALLFLLLSVKLIIKLEHRYLQKMKIVLVANLMQVLPKMNVIHFPSMLSTELSLCVVLF